MRVRFFAASPAEPVRTITHNTNAMIRDNLFMALPLRYDYDNLAVLAEIYFVLADLRG